MSHITKEVFKNIEEKKIIPKSKWYFKIKNYISEIFLAVIIFAGALSVTTILFMFLDHDWDIFEYLNKSFWGYVFISIPYFWLISLLLLSITAYYIFKHTRQGYRYEIYKVIIGSLLLSLSVGIILFWGGLDSEIHELFSEKIPFYDNLVYTKKDIWIFPSKGLLSGEVVDIKNKNDFKLRDFNGDIWQIQGNRTIWPNNFVISKGVRIKLIGQRKDSQYIFLVKEVKPWDWDR